MCQSTHGRFPSGERRFPARAAGRGLHKCKRGHVNGGRTPPPGVTAPGTSPLSSGATPSWRGRVLVHAAAHGLLWPECSLRGPQYLWQQQVHVQTYVPRKTNGASTIPSRRALPPFTRGSTPAIRRPPPRCLRPLRPQNRTPTRRARRATRNKFRRRSSTSLLRVAVPATLIFFANVF